MAASQLLPLPTAFSVTEASVLPEAACTVYFNLAMIAGLRAGQTVLIHGAGGGIGTFAIQWATAIEVTVITTAGSDAKTQIGQSLGASTAINYRTDDFVAATLAATDGRGVDAILDVVGARLPRPQPELPGNRRPLGHHRRQPQPYPVEPRPVDIRRGQRHRDDAATPFHPAES